VLSHEILNAKPYAFLDDAPLEERRTQAVYTRRAGDVSSANDLGALDQEAIVRVREEERPDPRDADELHDALLTAGFLTDEDARPIARGLFDALAARRRATRVKSLWVAAERLPEIAAVHPGIEASIAAPANRNREWTREAALIELLRGRMTILGPTTVTELAVSLDVSEGDVETALIALETEGVILRGSFRIPDPRFTAPREWCDRRLLARIHRYTINRLRAEIEPVSAAAFMRFLFAWQHVTPSARLSGIDGLQKIVAMLDGYEVAASAWERAVLPARMDRYDESLLDMLCLAGEVGWARLSAPTASTVVSATPIALFLRDHSDAWRALRDDAPGIELGDEAKTILETLRARGASFARELSSSDGGARALGELVSAGLIASDGFAGLRGLVTAMVTSNVRQPRAAYSGRWSLLGSGNVDRDDAVETQARVLLRRYGIVFRRLLTREPNAAPWRELAKIYRRMEARGEIRGGRFVHGMSGEQFALAEAVEQLREIRRQPADGKLIVISAADPLNLVGILTTDERVRAATGTRIAYRDGVAVSVMEGDYLRPLVEMDADGAMAAGVALAGRRVAASSGWVGR
jgi:ATP-dependent helicase Lhr and Lhr-like helicase